MTKELVRKILEAPLQHDWTLQGLGMLRLYLSDELRLHIWDDRFAEPGVSDMHTHPWDLESTIVAGKVRNGRFVYHVPGDPYDPVPVMRQPLFCGAGGGLIDRPEEVELSALPLELYTERQTYRQRADEIHVSSPERGTVTIVRRRVPAGRSPDLAWVFWPAHETWVSAEPRPATGDEVLAITTESLRRWF